VKSITITSPVFVSRFSSSGAVVFLAFANFSIAASISLSVAAATNFLISNFVKSAGSISGKASTSMLQRRFQIGYARAARIIDQMELAGYISAGNGSKLRTVHMSMSEFKEKFGEDI
jgi:hypothetical protein